MQRGLIGDLISVIRVISVIRGLLAMQRVTMSSDFTKARGRSLTLSVSRTGPDAASQRRPMRTIRWGGARLRVVSWSAADAAAETRDARRTDKAATVAPEERGGRSGCCPAGFTDHGGHDTRVVDAPSGRGRKLAGHARSLAGSGPCRARPVPPISTSPIWLSRRLPRSAPRPAAPPRRPAPDSDSHPSPPAAARGSSHANV